MYEKLKTHLLQVKTYDAFVCFSTMLRWPDEKLNEGYLCVHDEHLCATGGAGGSLVPI